MEHVIWGTPPNATGPLADTLLYTGCTSSEQAERIMAVLAKDHGCTKMRIQVLDGTIPDFAAART